MGSGHACSFANIPHQIEVENLAIAICDYGNGVTGQFYASTSDIPSGERVEIVGDKGMLVLDEKGLRFLELETPLEEHLHISTGAFEAPKRAWRDVPNDGEGQSHSQVIAAFARDPGEKSVIDDRRWPRRAQGPRTGERDFDGRLHAP